MRLIINADDCGKNLEVDNSIARFIEAGKLTSTTVMANMDDFDGAVRLFHQYKDSVSFGVHLNLTEGSPLLYSQELLDKGYYRESAQGGLTFETDYPRQKMATGSVRRALERELCAQIEKVLDSGINISHIDSHHHIHTTLLLLGLMPKLSKRYGINKMRQIRNYVPSASRINIALRHCWTKMIHLQNPAIVMPDFFCAFLVWHESGQPVRSDNTTWELMCHPGGFQQATEEPLLFGTDFSCLKDIQLINYNEL